VRAPFDVAARPFRVISNRGKGGAVAGRFGRVVVTLPVCVPAHGFSDVTIPPTETSPIFGDMRNATTFGLPRRAGVLFTEIAVADEIGPAC
jgi:hypothetical protein